MDTSSINIRYSALAEQLCCLSCGSAISYARVQTGECCVDLGSGRGTDALRLAEATGEMGYVFGIDASDGMLRAAKEMLIRSGKEHQFHQVRSRKNKHSDGIADLVFQLHHQSYMIN
jgi:SAM-dependent methyltransferase